MQKGDQPGWTRSVGLCVGGERPVVAGVASEALILSGFPAYYRCTLHSSEASFSRYFTFGGLQHFEAQGLTWVGEAGIALATAKGSYLTRINCPQTQAPPIDTIAR